MRELKGHRVGDDTSINIADLRAQCQYVDFPRKRYSQVHEEECAWVGRGYGRGI